VRNIGGIWEGGRAANLMERELKDAVLQNTIKCGHQAVFTRAGVGALGFASLLCESEREYARERRALLYGCV